MSGEHSGIASRTKFPFFSPRWNYSPVKQYMSKCVRSSNHSSPRSYASDQCYPLEHS